MDGQRVLIVEDEAKAFKVLKRVLMNMGWEVDSAPNGRIALDKLLKEKFDAVLTDLNMPIMNGMELVSCIQGQLSYQPLILMFSAFFKEEIKQRALEQGVYKCLSKPVDFKELSQAFHQGLREMKSRKKDDLEYHTLVQRLYDNGSIGEPNNLAMVGIAVSTGGPQTLKSLFLQLPANFPLPILIVIHSPNWAIQAMIQNFNENFPFTFLMAEEGQVPESEKVYIAPSGFHMELKEPEGTIQLNQKPLENFVRPSADPLFRSMAKVCGSNSIALVLSGLGKDGAQGAAVISRAGATVLVQSPATATAPFMPRAALEANPQLTPVPLPNVGKALFKRAREISNKLIRKTEQDSKKNSIPAGEPL